jgi:outer membrane protein assembly factor BamB
MKSPICVTNSCVINRKQTASFSVAGLILAIMPLWLMLAAANTSQAQTTSSPADWTQFLKDNMQRYNPYETVLSVNSVGGLKPKWTFTTIGSSPAVANGVVYIGSYDHNVYALNASTGAKLWSYTTGQFVDASPAVANGVVYIASEDGNMYALNASTGAKLWSFAFEDGDGSQCPATVVDGVVYVGAEDLNLYALNASTGAKLWSFATRGGVTNSPAVVNGMVFLGGTDTNIYGLNASTGAKLWSFGTGHTLNTSTAVANGVVYVGSDYGNFYALNASTGALLWSQAAGPGQDVGTAPAVANGVVYIASEDGAMYALNASTGAKLWSFATGGGVGSPAVANGVVYFGSGDGNLYGLNASTGAKLLSFQTDTGVGSPAVVDGVVYVAAGFNVFAFGLGGGGGGADLFLRIRPTPTTVQQGDLITYAFPVWNLGPDNADQEVLNTQVPEGTTLDYVRISGTPGLGTCTTPPYGGTGEIVCHENSAMAPNTTWTVRVVVKVTAPSGTVITESATTTEDTFDPNLANNTATVSTTVQ